MSNDQSKFGVQDHGETLTIDLSNPKTKELMSRISSDAGEANGFLADMFLALYLQPKITLPCKKCLLDTALQFKDVGAMLEELANGK